MANKVWAVYDNDHSIRLVVRGSIKNLCAELEKYAKKFNYDDIFIEDTDEGIIACYSSQRAIFFARTVSFVDYVE